MERFIYEGGYGICGDTCIEAFKAELAWAIDKHLVVISDVTPES